MSETWYRGESVSVTPAKAGGVVNDIGDGMYLTDKLQVAQQYAQERAPLPEDRRVYAVRVDGSEMRVLDLTKDPRWAKILNTSIPSQPGETFETMLRRQPSSQQYKNAFEGFLANNKINLNDYDAVIGYEYRSSGKQMCVLYKNGQPSPVQTKLRLLFVPIGGTNPTPKSPPGTLQFGGKIGPGLKIAGGALLTVAVQILLNWLLGKLIQKQQEENVKRQWERLIPAIETDIRSKIEHTLKLLVDGKNAFATVRVSIIDLVDADPETSSPGAPTIKYLSLEIGDNKEDKPDGEETEYLPGLIRMFTYYYKMSFPLTYSHQEVELYRAYLKEIKWYEEQIKIAASIQDTERLNRDRNKLINQLKAALAD